MKTRTDTGSAVWRRDQFEHCSGAGLGRLRAARVVGAVLILGVFTTGVPNAAAATSGGTTVSLGVAPPPVRSVTVSPASASCSPNLVFPNGTCGTPAVTVSNGTIAGHINVNGANAIPSDNGVPWALCCAANGVPGVDQFAMAAIPSNNAVPAVSLMTAPVPDTIFGASGTAAASESQSELIGVTGPSSSTDTSLTFTTSVTWVAVP